MLPVVFCWRYCWWFSADFIACGFLQTLLSGSFADVIAVVFCRLHCPWSSADIVAGGLSQMLLPVVSTPKLILQTITTRRLL